MRYIILILAIAVGLCTEAATAEEQKTLAECIAIAIAQHPSLKAAAATVEAGHQRIREAAASYLPQINVLSRAARGSNVTLAPTTGTSGGGGLPTSVGHTTNQFSSGVNFTQILFDFGQILNGIRAARAAEESLEADRSTQQETVVLNVKQAYFNLLAAHRLLSVADETVRQNQKHLDQAQARFKVGLAAKFDVTQAQVQLAQAELNQVTARNNVAVAHETLRNALGLTTPLDFDIVDNFDIHSVQITEDKALSLAYDKRPELESLRAQERSTSEQISALQKNYLPNVTSNGNYQWARNEASQESVQDNWTWNIGASVNFSIFNGGLTTAQIAEQKANLANIKYNEELERQSIALQVRQDVLNLQQAAESIRVSEKGVQQARENLQLAEGRYNTGVGNIIELTDAQASRTTADASYVQALYSYKTAVAALEQATAQTLATD